MAHQPSAGPGPEPCLVCNGQSARVIVAMRHPVDARFTRELLERDCGCWVTAEPHTGVILAQAMDGLAPDLPVANTADLAARFSSAIERIPLERIIVIAPSSISRTAPQH